MKKNDLDGRIWKRRNLGQKRNVVKLLRRDDLPPAGQVGDLAELTEIFTTMQRDEDRRAEGA